MKNTERPARPRGRPRAFDRSEALARAAMTFWRLGYEGASIADLTAAMGITPQSLYAAFSSKADLYREALTWYQETMGASTQQALAEDDVVTALVRVLREAARDFAAPDRPPGCMISTAVLTCAVENDPIAHHVTALRTATLAAIADRIQRGIADGQLKPETDPRSLARFVGAMIQGMSVQARDGATEAELSAMVDHAAAAIGRYTASRAM